VRGAASTGTAIRDYIHACDLVEAHVQAINRLFAEGQNIVVNLGTRPGLHRARWATLLRIPHSENCMRSQFERTVFVTV
jgi:nucleoside-diphosphate-sugar epimerase